MRHSRVGVRGAASAALPAALAVALVALLAFAAWQALLWRKTSQAEDKLRARISERVPGDPGTATDCRSLALSRLLVLLVLGQSNAGNHGTRYGPTRNTIPVLTDKTGCFNSRDPLPGATGSGGSIWSRLPAQMQAAGFTRPVVVGLLAVDATSMRDWTAAHGTLAALMTATAQNMVQQGLRPDFVVWQHGESDAQMGTPPDEYVKGLLALSRQLRVAGISAPWLLARSTVCRSGPAESLHAEFARLVAAEPGFVQGANTDSLASSRHRRDGCHFNEAGLDAAAHLWALLITAEQR